MNKCKQAEKEFGLTDNFYEAGWIMPDGKLIDFSGKNEGGTPNRRPLDHRDIGQVCVKGGTEGLSEFMEDCKSIRFSKYHDGGVHADMTRQPTSEQCRRLREALMGSEYLVAERSDKEGITLCKYETDYPDIFAFQRFVGQCFIHYTGDE